MSRRIDPMAGRDEIARLARKAGSGDLAAAKRLVAELEAKERRDPAPRPDYEGSKWEVQVRYCGMVNYVVVADDPEDAAARAKANFSAGFEPVNLGNEWERFEAIGEVHRLYDDHEIQRLCSRCNSLFVDDMWDEDLEMCATCAEESEEDERADDDE